LSQIRLTVMISLVETLKGKIEYNLLGQGRPILFIHGGHVNCKETIFQKGLDLNNYCFITPSRPGYGETPLSILNKSPKGSADLIMALLDELRVTKTIVIGISAGGLTALEIAANFPNRVESLILMSALTKKWLMETNKVYFGGKIMFSPRLEKFSWLLYKLFFRCFPKTMTGEVFRQLSTYRPVEYSEDEFQELKKLTLNMRSGLGFVNDLDQTIDQEILTRIECPTLILHSNYDNQVGMDHPLNANGKIKNSRLITFDNHWGHLLWLGGAYDPILSELKKEL